MFDSINLLPSDHPQKVSPAVIKTGAEHQELFCLFQLGCNTYGLGVLVLVPDGYRWATYDRLLELYPNMAGQDLLEPDQMRVCYYTQVDSSGFCHGIARLVLPDAPLLIFAYLGLPSDHWTNHGPLLPLMAHDASPIPITHHTTAINFHI